MNVQLRPAQSVTTQAAEGLPRRMWTIDDVERMVAAGIIAEHERIELIDGDIVPMSPKGNWHENVKRALTRYWVKALPSCLEALTETTLQISPNEYREPDFVFWPSAVPVKDLKAEHLLLVAEIADTSLDYDLGRKASFYASLGIADYWVIDAKRLVTTIHRDPSGDGYRNVAQHAADALLTPLHIPALAVRLTDLGLEPLSE